MRFREAEATRSNPAQQIGRESTKRAMRHSYNGRGTERHKRPGSHPKHNIGHGWEFHSDRKDLIMEYAPTTCPGCGKGHVVWITNGSDYYFKCSRKQCGWECGRGGKQIAEGLKGLVGVALYGGRIRVPRKLPKKKHQAEVKFVPDSPAFKKAFRAEVERRMEILLAERAKFPPTLIKKGKKWISNPKFTNEMRDHMHKFYVDAEEIRKEMLHA